MDAKQIVAFLEALKTKKIKVREAWVVASCPLAPWTHAKGTDNTPSFGISISPGDRSYFQCFSCTSGSVEELLQALELYSKGHSHSYDFKLCRQLLDDENQILPLPEYEEHELGMKAFVEWPQYWIESFLVVSWYGEATGYLKHRGYSYEEVAQYDLRYDPKRQMIVCPYRDVFGRLAGARGRSIHDDVSGSFKHYDYSWQGKNNCRFVWYHEEVLNLDGPVVVVEGQFDCWKTLQSYPKVVANLTAKPTPEKVRKLADSSFIIQIPDRDEAGKMSMDLYMKLCVQFGIGYKAIWLDEGVKDPADCHPEYLKEKIEALL